MNTMTTLAPTPPASPPASPWLGALPAHWDVRRLKHWVSINESVLSETTGPDFEFRYLEIGAIDNGELIQESGRVRFSDAPSKARRVVKNGDTMVFPTIERITALGIATKEQADFRRHRQGMGGTHGRHLPGPAGQRAQAGGAITLEQANILLGDFLPRFNAQFRVPAQQGQACIAPWTLPCIWNGAMDSSYSNMEGR